MGELVPRTDTLRLMHAVKPFTRHRLSIRHHTAQVLTWGDPAAEPVLMLHGWMDVASSFQFLVDAMQQQWFVIAPDQRGYGGTDWTRESGGGYWFADYVADLEAVIDHFSPDAPINLVGHSLGGNVCCTYAGVRPHRVKKLVSLDGFGVPAASSSKAPERYAKWLDSVKAGEALSSYESIGKVADRLQKNNARLTRERAEWLAQHWAELRADGRWHLRADPAHKMPFPTVYRLDEAIAIWSQVTAPTLWLGASESAAKQWNGYTDDTTVPTTKEGHASGSFASRLCAFKHLQFEVIQGAGHMLHHDVPEVVAARIEAHLGA
jgi:pimeloyl-ACP methyl ester carboxylesterase